jgi:hypothetical protein
MMTWAVVLGLLYGLSALLKGLKTVGNLTVDRNYHPKAYCNLIYRY